jgi:hypothetical protein
MWTSCNLVLNYWVFHIQISLLLHSNINIKLEFEMKNFVIPFLHVTSLLMFDETIPFLMYSSSFNNICTIYMQILTFYCDLYYSYHHLLKKEYKRFNYFSVFIKFHFTSHHPPPQHKIVGLFHQNLMQHFVTWSFRDWLMSSVVWNITNSSQIVCEFVQYSAQRKVSF